MNPAIRGQPVIRRAAARPCEHVRGRREDRVFVDLSQRGIHPFAEIMLELGYHRQQDVAIRNACVGCRACSQIRVPVEGWTPNSSQARAMRRNAGLSRTVSAAGATMEQYRLFSAYQRARHPGSEMGAMGPYDFAAMVENTTIDTRVVEWREPSDGRRPGTLAAAMLVDVRRDSISLEYGFHDASDPRRSLGTFMIADLIASSRGTGARHVYLGLHMPTSPKLAYKASFRPHQVLSDLGWTDGRSGGPASF